MYYFRRLTILVVAVSFAGGSGCIFNSETGPAPVDGSSTDVESVDARDVAEDGGDVAGDTREGDVTDSGDAADDGAVADADGGGGADTDAADGSDGGDVDAGSDVGDADGGDVADECEGEPPADGCSCNYNDKEEGVCGDAKFEDGECTPSGTYVDHEEEADEAKVCGDELDNDCDGTVDDGCPCTFSTQEGNNEGVCEDGTIGEDENCVPPSDYEETESSCNDGKDNDCDGHSDCGDPDCQGESCGGINCCSGDGSCQPVFCN